VQKEEFKSIRNIFMEPVSASKQQLDYMTLLVTQMQNQNPLEPMDNQQMAAQLAQLSQLQLTEEMNGNIETMNSTMGNMNTSFQGAMLMAELDFAKSLLGKEVSFYSGYYDQIVRGQVQKVSIIDGQPTLEVHAGVILPDESQSDELVFPVRPFEVGGIKEWNEAQESAD
jgi:flagellar basal-body rod modification protein FlgD